MEQEIALALPPSSNQAVLDWLHALPNTHFERSTKLLNVYLDTHSQDLKRQKAAVRLRFDTEGLRWIQTIKTSGTFIDDVQIRQEWENVLTNAAASNDIIPQLEIDLFAKDAQNFLKPLLKNLHPVFNTDFTRDIFQYSHDNDSFELAFDHGVIHLSDTNSKKAIIINELEIEFKSGNIEHMIHLAKQAQASLHAEPQILSKAARGYMLMAST